MQLKKPYRFLFIKLLNIFSLKIYIYIYIEKERERECDQMFVPEVLRERRRNREKGYEDTEKETEKERGDEDTVKKTEKERGDPGTWRKKRLPLCF